MLFYLKLVFLPVYLFFAGALIRSENPRIAEKIKSFEAISDGKKVVVSWTVPNERTFDYYTIERSKDGTNFITAMMIKGAGRVSTIIDYTDIDYTPFSGISYYRLKQTDYSGESFYSETIAVNFQLLKDGTIIPRTEKIPDESELQEIAGKMVLVVMRDNKGHEYISKISVTSENGQLYARGTKGVLDPGTYMVIASSFNRLFGQKLVVR
jgi:hypothetical protein